VKLNTKIVCADGFSMSVQASGTAYCTPRKSGAARYSEVEVGFPSSREDLLLEYAEDRGNPTETIYGWVPANIVSLVIAKHGGIVEGQLPPGVPRLRAANESW
jgi:hypothetical protein